jgi:hypothetical protein
MKLFDLPVEWYAFLTEKCRFRIQKAVVRRKLNSKNQRAKIHIKIQK